MKIKIENNHLGLALLNNLWFFAASVALLILYSIGANLLFGVSELNAFEYFLILFVVFIFLVFLELYRFGDLKFRFREPCDICKEPYYQSEMIRFPKIRKNVRGEKDFYGESGNICHSCYKSFRFNGWNKLKNQADRVWSELKKAGKS